MSNNSSLCSGESGLSGVYSEYDRQFSAEDEKKVRRSVSQAVRIYLRASQASARLKIKVDFANAEAIRHSMVIYRPPIVEFQLDQVELNSAVTDKKSSKTSMATERSSAGTDTRFTVVASTLGYRKRENPQPPKTEVNKSQRVKEWLEENEKTPKMVSKKTQTVSEEVVDKALKEKPAEDQSEISDATLKYVNSMTTIDDEYSISSEAAGPVGSISEDLLNGKPQKRVQVGGGLLDLIK
ncbi:unnamed protein product [Bursaphelenchus xylophilus]|uniref:(pine wood nematode) hypothetical protein n=1 Tax=Bursaphelenchus xylophilus TaxID=6326 RepID=A0A7I8X0U9_BURXY|nr:unnamed protein product [Bursaphelenchus xylophilus]CAG9130099.1 unnamed protein product [Bursaphelenchus xylophilus]